MSIEFRTRDEHSSWSNVETITDLREALSLLQRRMGSTEPTHLRRSLIGIRFVWEIAVPWCRDAHGRDTSGTDYYDVNDEVAKHLRDEMLVEPYIVKGWGWSYPDLERLVITSEASASLAA